jgi:thymidylate synthase
MIHVGNTADQAWFNQLEHVSKHGIISSPRKIKTVEILADIVEIYMRYPVISNIKRGLSYQFMASEALWIISGSDKLNFNKHINEKLKQFSDDGKTLSGAYGIPFSGQINWVVDILTADPDSRQAVIAIWKPKPFPSKDIPCTIGMQFLIRKDTLHTNVFMRSSDVWLGLPYDLFSFSVMSMAVGLLLQIKNLGNLTVFMGSSHLYEENFGKADELLSKGRPYVSTSPWSLERIKSLSRLIGMLTDISNQEKNSKAGELLFSGGDYFL